MDWYRCYTGTVTDPKFTYIASKTGQNVATVLAVWFTIMERASDAYQRGCCSGLDHESLDVHLGIDEGATLLIYQAMQLKGMISADDVVTAWDKRQPKYEDPTAAERKRAQRERERQQLEHEKSQQSQTVTECHGMSQHVTTEEKRIEKTLKPFADDDASAAPAITRKTRKPPSKLKSNSQHAWLSRWWCWSTEKITGGRYLYAKKDAGAIDTMLKRSSLEETIERAAVYLSLPEEQRFPRGSPTTTGLLGMFNQLAGRTEAVDKLIRSGLLPADGRIAAFTPWEEENAA